MKRKQKRLGLIYTERIAPIVSGVALILITLIPSVEYSLDSKKQGVLSLWQLLGNCWTKTRNYLFSASVQQTNDERLFSQAVFTAITVMFILFVLGFAVSLWASAVSLIYYRDKAPTEDAERSKNIFTAIIPNRFVLSLLRFLVVPLFFFPDILAIFYQRLLLYNVSVKFTTIHYGLVSIILFIAVTVITALSAKREKQLNMNIFAKKKLENYEDEEDYESDEEDSKEEPVLKRMKEASVLEQTERLRMLFGSSDEDNESKK
ncbi:MAG: hypothetical protein IJV72_01025 [Clostridia bacterium]|nr:hypothetical protein [Clostridia bacterium]